MANRIYVGDMNGKARKVTNLYVSPWGNAKKVKRAYVGVNGVAQLCYINLDTSVTLYGGVYDSITYTYNNVTKTVTTNSYGFTTVTIALTEETASITFTSITSGFSRTATITAGVSDTVYVRPRYSYIWYGYEDLTKTVNPYAGDGGRATVNSDNTVTLDHRTGIPGYSYDGYAAVSVLNNNSKFYIYGYLTGDGMLGADKIRYGSSSLFEPNPRHTSDFNSYNTYTVNSVDSFKLTKTGASSGYFAVGIYSSDESSSIEAIIQGIGYD